MKSIEDIPSLAQYAHQKLRGIYNGTFEKELSQYKNLIEARMLSNRDTPAAAMVHLFNSTESKIIRAWLLAAVWDITHPFDPDTCKMPLPTSPINPSNHKEEDEEEDIYEAFARQRAGERS